MLVFASMFFHASTLYILFYFVFGCSVLFVTRDKVFQKVPFIAFFVFVMLGVVLSFFKSSVDTSNILLVIPGIILAYVSLKYGLEKKYAWLFFLLVSAIIIGRLILTSSNQMVFIASRNNISAWILLSSLILYISYRDEQIVPVIPAVIALIISLLGEGASVQ